MKNSNVLLMLAAIFAIAIYPISIVASLIVAVVVLIATIAISKFNSNSQKALQPLFAFGLGVGVRGLFALLIGVIQMFGGLFSGFHGTGFARFLLNFGTVLNIILFIYLGVVIVFALIALFAKKDMIIFGNLTKKAMGEDIIEIKEPK